MAIPVNVDPEDRETATWRSMPALGLDLISARFLKQVFPPHFHETYVVCVDERGAHASWYRGANRIVPERALTLVPPGEVHTGQRVPGQVWHYRAVYPSLELMRQVTRDAGVKTSEVALSGGLSVNDPELTEAFLAAHRTCEVAPESLRAESTLTEVLVTLLSRHADGLRCRPEPPAPAHLVDVIREHFQANLARRVTLADLAGATGLTQYAVLRGFRLATGIPPHRYLTQLRVRRAAELLRQGESPVMVAHLVGFADQSHLNRHFRRLVGVTPGVFARRR
ncbi:MAG: AraC family transcriptional regulator [Gemmatimonadales bacterium]|nr:AraC family transcriptional regulator [Gemmatimonadales bacterium]